MLSMFFFLCIVLLGIITACLPFIVSYISKPFHNVKLYPAKAWLPVAAGILIVVSTQLPNIHISKQTSTFQQHFVGGGMYSACLYLYAKQLFNWRLHWLVDLLALFAWVSAFGVANKMMEFTLLELQLAHIDTADAYWDLLANTLGGFVGYFLLYKVAKIAKIKR
jgi:hypothetical protein